MTGCASSPGTAGSVETPDWLNELPPQDVLWGIRIARQSSPSMSMTTAEARARTSIARQLQAFVDPMYIDYNLDAGNVNNQANTSMQQDVSRQTANINLSGASPIKRWQASDGTWWVLVEYQKSDARSEFTSILNNQEAAFAQFKAQQALDYMDSQLARNERPLQVND